MRVFLGEIARIVLLLAVSFFVTGLIIIFTKENPLNVFRILVRAAVWSRQGLAETLSAATPLIFTGLAIAVAFKAGLFNVGVEGSLYLGAFSAAWVGFTLTHLPGWVLISLALLVSGLIGGLWALGPAVAKVCYNVDEIVTTLMLNYVAIFFTTYLVTYIYGVPGFANAMSFPIVPAARLPRLSPPSQLNLGFVIAILIALVLWFIFRRTAFGYEIRMLGANPLFVKWCGMPDTKIVIKAMFLSGFLGGVAGAIQILGIHYRFIANFSPGYGYTGIAVALLARNNPLGVLFSSFLLGAIYNGESIVELMTNIPMEIPRIFEGIIIALTSAELVMGFHLRRRRVGRQGDKG
ncbi:MAG: ABC transporter permease [Candidatus Hadarchaeum sp.]|uniref:ABC transporter permease n=1 Tax=Candidatus Hadarchaeum sp. TaxID=2883567 RepID=UPI003D115A23